MWTYSYYPTADELYHHGILGQKWGKRNGSPYPLGASDHSSSEKKAGWRDSLVRRNSNRYNRNSSSKLSDKQKKMIKIGAAAIGVSVLAIGAHKLGYDKRLVSVIKNGRKEINRTALFGCADDVVIMHPGFDKALKDSVELNSRKLKYRESLSEVLSKVNPLYGTPGGLNNCSSCALAGHMRMLGFDVKAKSLGGKPQNLNGLVEECFTGAKVLDGSAVKFGKSPNDAAEMLLKRYGDNASGACGISWDYGGGHIFNWFIKDGEVKFVDFQQKIDSIDHYWNHIDTNGVLQIARLDTASVKDLEALKKYIDI